MDIKGYQHPQGSKIFTVDASVMYTNIDIDTAIAASP